MKDIKKHYQDLIKDINISNDKIVNGLKNHITWLESKINNYKDSRGDFDVLKKEHEELVSEYNKLKFKFSQHDEAYNRVIKENLELKNENKQLKKALPNNGETVSPTTVKKVQKPVKSKAKKSDKTRGTRPKNILCRCVDCKKYYYAANKLSKRCASCKLKHMYAYQKEWKKKRAQK